MSGKPAWLFALTAAVGCAAVFFAAPAGAYGTGSAVAAVGSQPHAARTVNPVVPRPIAQAVAFAGTPAVGALVTASASGALGSHFCTASVVDSPAGNLVITAAHCLTGRQASQFVFVPGYDNGQAPYGVWPVRDMITDRDWRSASDPDDDVAFLVLDRSVQGVTGGERLGTGQPPSQLVTVIGYPDNRDTAITCLNYSGAFSATQLEFRCGGYTAGTSGGPLLADIDAATGLGTVIGVIGGYQQGGRTDAISYAATLGTDSAALYQAAITGT